MNNNSAPSLHYAQIRCYVMACLLVCFFCPVFSQAGDADSKQDVQNDSTSSGSKTTKEKLTLRMSFEAFKINHDLKLVARVRSKVDTKFQNTAGVEISFYKDEIRPDNFIGKDISNHKGEGYWMIPLVGRSDSTASHTYWAAVEKNSDYEDAEETVSVNPSIMTMKLEEKDTSRLVLLFVGHPDKAGLTVPLKDVECKVYVKREFGLLPVSDAETTDDEGNISLEFPDSIHGDQAGNLTVVAKIDGNEILGNVEVSKTIAWGIPVEINNFNTQRELWSARANSPIPLIIVVNGALLLIWGLIAFIFLEIFRINRLGKTN